MHTSVSVRGSMKSNWDVIFLVLASPVFFIRWLFQLRKQWRFWRLSYSASIECRNCKAKIWLVGVWRCTCAFTYRGHLMRVCPVCGSLPRMARCFACGITQKLPEPS